MPLLFQYQQLTLYIPEGVSWKIQVGWDNRAHEPKPIMIFVTKLLTEYKGLIYSKEGPNNALNAFGSLKVSKIHFA